MRAIPNGSTRRACAIVGVAVMMAGTIQVRAANWPQFRGRQASGIGDGKPPTTWDVETGRNVKWKARIPGLGHASPIVWDDRVFLTTAVSSAKGELELTTGWEAADGHSARDRGPWTWRILCLDANTGERLWEKDAHRGEPMFKRHPKSSHANGTPVTDGRYVVVSFGAEGLYCYDFAGRRVWKKTLGKLNGSPSDSPDLEWGFASSPVIHDGLVVMQCDCANTNFWVAFDVATGREVRRVQRDEDSTWSTPSVFVAAGRTQLVLNGYKHMGAYDLHTGAELWKLSGGGDLPVPAPLFAHGLIFLTNGHGSLRPIYAIRADARGDLTPTADRNPAGLAWWHRRAGSYIPTPIVYGDNLYVCNDTGILTVMDARTGRQHYRKRLAGGGVNYSASAVAADGKVYFTSERGDVHVLQAGDEYRLLASNRMNEICMATPAIADGRLFIRTRSRLYCLAE